MSKHRLEVMITFDDEASCEAVREFISKNCTLPTLPGTARVQEIHTSKKYKTGIEELPTQQRKVLEFIRDHTKICGYPPSIEEIANYLGTSSSFGIRKHLEALTKKGFITREGSGLARAIKIL